MSNLLEKVKKAGQTLFGLARIVRRSKLLGDNNVMVFQELI